MAAPVAAAAASGGAASAGAGNAAVGNAAVESYFGGSAMRNDDAAPMVLPRKELEAKAEQAAAAQKDDKGPTKDDKGPKEDVGASIGRGWQQAGNNLRFGPVK